MHFTSAAPQSVACDGGTAGGMLPDLASLPFLTGRSASFGALLRYRFLVERVTIVLIEESRLKDFVTALVEIMLGGQSLDMSIWLTGPGRLCGVCPGSALLVTCWYQLRCTNLHESSRPYVHGPRPVYNGPTTQANPIRRAG